jgi:peptidoglycan/LPS O-acetylase OafA/YrhL
MGARRVFVQGSAAESNEIRSDLRSVQYLRGVAALMVVAFHASSQISRAGGHDIPPTWLAHGVDIFFVISGCIMWITTAPPLRISPSSFYWKRIVRIVPLYWFISSVMVLTMLFAPSLVQTGRLDARHAILSYFFIPALHPVTGKLEPLVIPGWTLNYEMFFYLIFGALLLLPAARRIWVLVAIMLFLVAFGMNREFDQPIIGFYTSPIILEFAAGAVLGWIFLNKPPLPVFAAWSLITVGILMFPLLSEFLAISPLVLRSGVPAIVIVAGAIALDRRRAVALVHLPHLLGDASYSIYLCHGMLLSAAGQLWQKLGLIGSAGGNSFFIVFSLALSACGGILVHYYFERPVMRILALKSKKPRLVEFSTERGA